MADLRWWAEKTGKQFVLARDNAHYGIAQRVFVTNHSKARQLPNDALKLVEDEHVRMSLRLQEAFGLRREESIKFSPSFADHGDHLALKASWCKGGRAREIPVRTPEQRVLLREVHQLAGKGSLMPSLALRDGFIDRFVFPDAELHGPGHIFSVMHDAGFELRHEENLREHYARTLVAWEDNLTAHWPKAVAEVGAARARVWRLYLPGARIAFEGDWLELPQALGVKTGRGESAMPLRPDWEAPHLRASDGASQVTTWREAESAAAPTQIEATESASAVAAAAVEGQPAPSSSPASSTGTTTGMT